MKSHLNKLQTAPAIKPGGNVFSDRSFNPTINHWTATHPPIKKV